MPRLLYDKDSTAYCRRATHRHVRLLRRVPGTQDLVDAIAPLDAALAEKATASNEKELERDCAYDFIVAADFDQDNEVRKVFAAATQHDLAHPTAPVLSLIFPDATFGEIVREPLSRQPDTVDTLAGRIRTLPAEHPMRPAAEGLEARAKAVRDAIAAHGKSIIALKIAEAEEEIARTALRRQYESNYLAAREKFGRLVAEHLFPDLATRKKAEGKAASEGGDQAGTK